LFNFTEEHIRIHEDIENTFSLFIHNTMYDILDVNSFAGSGKSTIIADMLGKFEIPFICLFNKHDIAKEQKEKQEYYQHCVHIASRKELCNLKENYEDLFKKGININSLCGNCGFKEEGCEYYSRMRQIYQDDGTDWIGVHHHLNGLVSAYIEEKYVKVVIIDEYFLNAIYHIQDIYSKQLAESISFLSEIETNEARALVLAMSLLNDFNRSILTKKVKINPKKIYDKLINFNNSTVLNNEIYKLDIISDNYQALLVDKYLNGEPIIKNIVTPLLESFINIVNYSKIHSKIETIEYIKNVYKIIYNKKLERRLLNLQYFNKRALDIDCKIVILDATTPVNFYKELFDDKNVMSLQRDIDLNTVFYQLTTGQYVMTTLDNKFSKAKENLLHLTELVAEKHKDGKVLVVSRKKYEEEIGKLANNIVTAHYPLVGSNEYDNINVCVIFGAPRPNDNVIDRKSIILNCSREILIEIEQDSNVIQAIHRLRIALKQDIETRVYILTNIELPFENIKKYTLKNLIKLLGIEVRTKSYLIHEEGNIYSDIYNTIKENEGITKSKLNMIVRKKHNFHFYKETLKKMVDEGDINEYIVKNGIYKIVCYSIE